MTLQLTPAQKYINSDAGQRYAQFVDKLHACVVSFDDDSEQIETDNVAKILHDNVHLTEANSVGSALNWSFGEKHKPVLDLDMDVMVVPSSTRGHHHLYIDHEMPWENYSLLLWVLQHVGILQPNYVRACLARRESFLRTPWTRKGGSSLNPVTGYVETYVGPRTDCATCDGGGCRDCVDQ